MSEYRYALVSSINGKISHDRVVEVKLLGWRGKMALRGEFGACRGMYIYRDTTLETTGLTLRSLTLNI